MGLWDPFQRAVSWLINGGYYLLTNWDDPPSRVQIPSQVLFGCIRLNDDSKVTMTTGVKTKKHTPT